MAFKAKAPKVALPPVTVQPSAMAKVYGRQIPKSTPMIAVELAGYRDDWTIESGGLGREGHFRKAFKLMWPEYVWNDWTELMTQAWCTQRWICVIGHERAGKTYNFAHFALLDYLSDPENTLLSLCTVTFEGLKLRMWADLLHAVETGMKTNAAFLNNFLYRTTTNEMRVYPKQAAREAGEKYQIHGMAISRTADAGGRIRGGHAPRRIIIIDEANDAPDPIFEAVINPMSAPFARCVMLSNPVEKISRFGEWCEPEGGWSSVHDSDLFWMTKKGGICIHLDGLQSPNVKAAAVIVPGLLRNEDVQDVRKIHGEDSVQWWALIRGWFPPDGLVSRIFPSQLIEMANRALRFDFPPAKCATLDPAFEFDNCVLHFGDLGQPVFGEKRYAINCTDTMVVKFEVGAGAEPKDYQVAHIVIAECKKRGVRPEHFIMDRTGGGRGVFAIIQKEWSMDIQGVDYGGSATDRPLRADEPGKCDELFQYYVTELWFRAAECVRGGILGGVCNLDRRTADELSGRRYELKQGSKGSMRKAETKKEYQKRLGRSPDFADAFVQFGELLARLGTYPGGKMAALTGGSMWNKNKERAKRVASVYNEAMYQEVI
jgi:hypothetical protein